MSTRWIWRKSLYWIFYSCFTCFLKYALHCVVLGLTEMSLNLTFSIFFLLIVYLSLIHMEACSNNQPMGWANVCNSDAYMRKLQAFVLETGVCLIKRFQIWLSGKNVLVKKQLTSHTGSNLIRLPVSVLLRIHAFKCTAFGFIFPLDICNFVLLCRACWRVSSGRR